MKRPGRISVTRAASFGACAGVAGTAAMDLVLFARYQRDGGSQGLFASETSDGVDQWDNAAAPGQVGKRIVEGVTRRPLSDWWARPTSNIVHWATGLAWGAQFGIVQGSHPRRRWTTALLLGPTAWLSGYVILPLAKLYKPIWEYDTATLAKDLSAHMAYGLVTAATFAVVTATGDRS